MTKMCEMKRPIADQKDTHIAATQIEASHIIHLHAHDIARIPDVPAIEAQAVTGMIKLVHLREEREHTDIGIRTRINIGIGIGIVEVITGDESEVEVVVAAQVQVAVGSMIPNIIRANTCFQTTHIAISHVNHNTENTKTLTKDAILVESFMKIPIKLCKIEIETRIQVAWRQQDQCRDGNQVTE